MKIPLGSRAAIVWGLVGVAAICVWFSGGSGFLLGGKKSAAPVPTRSSVLVQTSYDESPAMVRIGGTAAATSVCICVAVASLGFLSRNRSVLQRQWRKEVTKKVVTPSPGDVLPPTLVVNWQVEEKIPEPGSEAMCEAMVGYDVEVGGGKAWDPFGFAKLYDRNFDFNNIMTWPHVQFLREAELKHGRICMLAFLGLVVPQWWQIPGYPQEPDWVSALDLCYQDPLARLGLAQISIFVMLVEGRWSCIDSYIGQMDREPGDFGFDPLGISKSPGFDLRTRQLRELKNGRLAMVGVMSMVSNHFMPGSVPFLTGAF